MLTDIRVISPETTYPIRHSILRPHQPYSNSQYKTDHLETTFHLGGFIDDRLVSVCSFSESLCDKSPYSKHYRLRAIATEQAYRNQHIGKSLILYAEDLLKSRHVTYLWCQGRVEVIDFYKKVGFKQYDDSFDYPNLGLHVIMAKKLIEPF